MQKVKLILGSMTFGPQVNLENSREMLKRFVQNGFEEVDAAYVYNNGDTERMLGDICDNSVKIATKVNPRISGKLDADAVRNQLTESLARLKRDKVDVFYFHFPDPTTPLENALAETNKLYQEGKIAAFGLSNYPAWEVVKIHNICSNEGWLKPSVYQGMYNGITRSVESELFPALRDLNMKFYAYNPLAGGILSGKYDSDQDSKEGRFTLRPNYKNRYWKPSVFKGIQSLTNVCEKEGISLIESAFRWLAFHSKIDGSLGDGIILGVSKVEHLDSNMNMFDMKLPNAVVEAYDDFWMTVKGESASYFRVPDKK